MSAMSKNAIFYYHPGCVACGRARELLGRAAFDVDERNVIDTARRQELLALGFSEVPIVVVNGRALAYFPESAFRRALGLPPADVPVERARDRVQSTLFTLRAFLGIVPHIPQELWSAQLVTDRDRPLGQWTWHVFRLAEGLMESAVSGAVVVSRENRERRTWIQESQFREFSKIAVYGDGVVRRLSEWSNLELAGVATMQLESPWGRITMLDRLDHLDRHSAVHTRQVVNLITTRVPDFAWLPSKEVLAQIPYFDTGNAD
jgi:glutaredoxin